MQQFIQQYKYQLTLVFPIAAVAFLLLVFFQYLPLMDAPLTVPSEDRRMRGADRLICALITVAYAVVAFFGLGNTQGIESFRKFNGAGDETVIEFPEGVTVSELRYYSGLYTGTYAVEFSDDGEFYVWVAEMWQGYKKVFKWNSAQPSAGWDKPVRFMRIRSNERLWLGELAIYDDAGRLVGADAMRVSEEDAALFDEQDMIPAEDDFMSSAYFDEIYHPRTAYEHIQNISPYEISHPPLGKVLMGIGIRIFGMVPFGWRFVGTLLGVLMLPAIYLLLKKMFGGTLVPACGTALLASDFLHFVQSRLATIDTYEVFFIILMYGFFWCYRSADRTRRRDWLPPLALSGLCFGLGAATKWTGFYAGAGLAVLWVVDRISRWRAVTRVSKKQKADPRTLRRAALREALENALWCLLFFLLIPAVIYYVSYWYYGTSQGMHGIGMLFSKEYLQTVLANQKYMFNYHSGLEATHPYSSFWWQWVLNIRPILYYLHYFPDGRESSFGAWMNPLLCWGGLLAMLCMGYLALAKRDRTALFILIGYVAQLLPWVFVTRVVFEYHYFPCSIFLLLALCHVLRTVELRHPWPKSVILSFTIASVVLFAAFYPALSGVPVPRWYDLKFLKWLPTWPF